MYFIYALTLQGKIFYVGSSFDPVTRYKTHVLNSSGAVFAIISNSIDKNKEYPGLLILDHHKYRGVAMEMERKMIRELSISNDLINCSGNDKVSPKSPFKLFDKKSKNVKGYYKCAESVYVDYCNKNGIKPLI